MSPPGEMCVVEDPQPRRRAQLTVDQPTPSRQGQRPRSSHLGTEVPRAPPLRAPAGPHLNRVAIPKGLRTRPSRRRRHTHEPVGDRRGPAPSTPVSSLASRTVRRSARSSNGPRTSVRAVALTVVRAARRVRIPCRRAPRRTSKEPYFEIAGAGVYPVPAEPGSFDAAPWSRIAPPG